MNTDFDPYRKWLGIPTADHPPNHYRLLGIELFETDPDVISNAADGRMAQVKSYQSGKYAPTSQRVLNEIAAAKICLLDAEKKSVYDKELQQRLSPASGEEAEPAAMAFDFATSPRRKPIKPKKPPQQPWAIYAVAAASVLLLGGVAAYLMSRGETPTADARRAAEPSDSAAKSGLADKKDEKEFARLPSKSSAKSERTAENPPTSVPANTGNARPASSAQKPKLDLAAQPQDEPDLRPLDVPKPSTNEKPESKPVVPTEVKPAPAAKPQRAEVPDKPQQQEAEAKIRAIFKAEFAAARTAENRAAFSKKLIEQAEGSKDDATARYVLLRIAGEQAVAAGAPSLAMKVVEALAASHDIDAAGMKADVLAAVLRQTSLSKEATAEAFETAMTLSEDAMSRDDFDLADRLVRSAGAAAQKRRDPDQVREVTSRTKEIERQKGRYASVQKALESLRSDESDAAAYLAVAQWLCFVKGDWKKGLPLLAKGSREDLAELARREAKEPAAPAEQVALADAWWALSEKDRSEAKAKMHARAVYWFERALPGLSGLEKTRVEKQIAATRSAPAFEVRGRGIVQRGNVALASNGTTVSGVEKSPESLLDGVPEKQSVGASKFPCAFTFTFAKVYMLKQVRFQIYGAKDKWNATYRIYVSRDGKNFELLRDHSKEPAIGWQEESFPARPVKVVKLEGVTSTTCNYFELTQFEAYCYPVSSSTFGLKPR